MADSKPQTKPSTQAERGRVLKSSSAPEQKKAFQKAHDPGEIRRPPAPNLQLSQTKAPVLAAPAAAPPVLTPPRPSTRQLLLYHHWQNSLQTQADTAPVAAAPSPDIGYTINQRRGMGSPLPPTIQTSLSTGLGTDLSDVRVHTDTQSDTLNQAVQAKAFTTGNDIFFRKGEYNPGSSAGMKLLAHEATHVRQQRQGPVSGTPIAGGVQVSDPQDRFEKEAESTANTLVQRMSLNGHAAAAPPPPSANGSNGHNNRHSNGYSNGHHPAPLQRQMALPLVQRCGCGVGACSCGQKNDDLQLSRLADGPVAPPHQTPLPPLAHAPFETDGDTTETPIQRFSQNGHQAQPALPLVQRCGCGVGTCSCGQKKDELQLSRSADGALAPPRTTPLDARTRALFEHSTGTDISDVAIHENDPAAEGQFAFAQHDEIHLAPQVPGPEHPLGAQVRLHEAAHVVQSRNGNGVQRTPLGNEQEAHDVAQAAMSGDKASVEGSASEGERQGWDWPSLDDIAKMGESALASLVEQISPGLAQLIREGPIGMLIEKIKDGVKSWIGSLAGNFDLGAVVDGLKGAFDTVLGLFDGQEDPASCSSFAQLLNKIRQFGAAFMDSAPFQMIKTVFDKVKGFLGKIKEVLLEPAFDVIKNIAGGVWDGVKAVVDKIKGWFAAAKEVAGRVWNWVKGKLGISDDGQGLWDWIKEKASEAWGKVKEFFAPIAGPLKTVVTILIVTNPASWPILIIRYLPPVLDAVEWLWAHRNDPDIIKSARNENKTELLKLLETGKSLGGGISSAADQMVEAITSVGTAVLEFLGGVTGIPLLSGLQSTVQFLSDGAKALFNWASKVFKKAADKVKEVFNSIKAALAPYIEILTSIGLCLVNPGMIPMVLAGWAWRKLDDCYKPPIIDFLLDIVIGVLENLPAMPMLGLLWPIVKAGVIGFLKGVKAQSDEMKIKVTNKLAKIISSPSLGFLTGLVKGIVTGLWEGLTDPFKLAYMVLKGLSALVQWAEGLAGEDVKATKASAVPTGEVQPAGANGTAPAGGDEEVVTMHKIRRGTPAASTNGSAPANGKGKSVPTGEVQPTTPAATPTTASKETVTLYKRPRGSKDLPTGEVQPTGAAAPKTTTDSNGDETTTLYRQPRPNEEEIITIRKEKSKNTVPTGEVQPGGGDGKLTAAQAQALVTGFGQFAGDIAGPAADVGMNFMPAVEEALGKSGDVTLDGLIAKLGDMWTSAEGAIQGFAAEMAGKVFQFFAGDAAEEKIGEDVGWVIGTVVFEVVLGVLTAGSWTAASPVLKVIQKFAKILDWTGEVVGVVFKGLGKLGGLLFKGKGALSKLLEKAGAAAAKVLEPLEKLATRFLNFADEMMGKIFGKAAKEAGEEAGELGAKKLAGEAGEEAGTQAGKQAGEEASEEAGGQAGKQAGEEAGEEAGGQTGKQAGEEASEEAGGQAGKQAGEEAGEEAGGQAGKQAGEEIGEEAPVVVGGPGHRPPDTPTPPRLTPEDEFKAAINAGGDGAVAKGRQIIDSTGDMKSLRKKVEAGELGDVDKAREALQKARQQAIDDAKKQVAENVKARHPDVVFDYKAPGTPKFTSDIDVTVMAKSKQRVDLEALGGRGPMAPDEAARALDDLGFPPGHPQRAELEALLKEGKLNPENAGKFLDEASVKAEIAASVDASDEFYKVLGDADKKLDANFYTELRVDDLTRKASPADQIKVHHEQSAVSMAEMRRNMSPDEWNAYKKSQLEAVEEMGDPATVARLQQQLDEAERIAKELEGKTLAQAKKELQDVLNNPNATLSEVREAMAKVKLLEPDAYGTHAAVKDVVDHLQTASRQSDQIKKAVDDAYKANGIDPARLNDPKYRAEVEDKLLAVDKQIKEQFGDQLDDIAGLRGAHGFEPGSPEHLAFLGQEASANMGKLFHSATPEASAKYLERIRYAAREAGTDVAGDMTDREIRAMIAAKSAPNPGAAADAALKEWGERTGRGHLSPEELRAAWMAETRKAAQQTVVDIRTAEQLEFENAAFNAGSGKPSGPGGGTPDGGGAPGGGAAAKEGGEEAAETGSGAAAKEGGEEAVEEGGNAAAKEPASQMTPDEQLNKLGGNPETREMLTNKPELRESLVDNPMAADILKQCRSFCFPPDATPAQVQRLEAILKDAQEAGYDITSKEVRENLKTFFHDRRTNLDGAMDELEVALHGADAHHLGPQPRVPDETKMVPDIKSKVKRSHDAGVEGGRNAAAADGVTVQNWENPDGFIGDYGRGFDDIGMGPNGERVILEWKGEGSVLSGDQMSSDWVGRKIAELKKYNDPMADILLAEAKKGTLKGRVYRTTIGPNGELITKLDGEMTFSFAQVNAAYQKRLKSAGKKGKGAAPTANGATPTASNATPTGSSTAPTTGPAVKEGGETLGETGGGATGKQTDELDGEYTGGDTPSTVPDQSSWKSINTGDLTPDEARLFQAVQNAEEVLVGRGINIQQQGMFTFDEWINANGITWNQRWQDVYNKAIYERAAAGKPTNVMSGRDYTLGEAEAVEAGAKQSGVVNKPYWPDQVGTPSGTTGVADIPPAGATQVGEQAGQVGGRATHTNVPEIEPGVVAKQPTLNGHNVKVLKDGRVIKCSTCGEIRQMYADELAAHPDLARDLDNIEAITDPSRKVQRAADLENELAIIREERALQAGPEVTAKASPAEAQERLADAIGDDRAVRKLNGDQVEALNRLDDDALATLRSMDVAEMGAAADLVKQYPEVAKDLLRRQPFSTAKELQEAIKTQSKRVTEPVPNLYKNLDVNQPPQGWKFRDNEFVEPDGTKVISTDVEYLDPVTQQTKFGSFQRAFNPQTGRFEMRAAFLEDLPNMVKSGTDMVAGKGTPTVTYVSLHQMKKMGGGFGALKDVKMSTIVNKTTILQLAWLRKKYPHLPADELIKRTHSVTYAETSIIQSGHSIAGAQIKNGQMTKASMWGDEATLAKYGLTPDDDVVGMFDIVLKVQWFVK